MVPPKKDFRDSTEVGRNLCSHDTSKRGLKNISREWDVTSGPHDAYQRGLKNIPHEWDVISAPRGASQRGL